MVRVFDDQTRVQGRDYFMVGRRAIFVGACAVAVVGGCITWGTMAIALRATSEPHHLSATQAITAISELPPEEPPENLGAAAFPAGAIILMSKDAGCPAGTTPFAPVMLLVNNNASALYEEALAATQDSLLDEGISWDARIFSACQYRRPTGGSAGLN
ncbi:hypothetical protein [Tropicimonas sp. S265A]|uniref:hypothetical protein n=1 Tax=Tropicimonas sp. S265A TaxID=3415134 RepID=UPI003C7CEC92